MARILIVDDEASMREFLEIFLRKEGYQTETVPSAEDAFAKLDVSEYDLILTDLKMPRASGIDVLERAKELWPETQVIVMTAYSTTETAVAAMKMGAYDYISKPFQVEEIRVIIQRALEKGQLSAEIHQKYSFHNIIGKSPAMQEVYDVIGRIAQSRTSVLITGDSGTGKELVAKAVHYNSARNARPFVVINCGAIPEQLMESEFFGHIKGAFTGAVATKEGLFLAAHEGTIFLDEIGELPLSLQVKLLRVLQERRIKPVGSAQEIDVDARVIAATNKDLELEVREGRFREDLYYRLNVIQIELPKLVGRQEDIPLIAEHFMRKYTDEMGKEIKGIDGEVIDALMGYGYPGNVRELENIIERAVTFEMSERLTLASLPLHVANRTQQVPLNPVGFEMTDEGVDLERTLEDLEKSLLLKALTKTRGVRTEAAKLLGISFRSIRYKLDKYNISEEELEKYRDV